MSHMLEVEFSQENTQAFSLAFVKAHGEHLPIVDTAPFINSRLEYAVSFPLPRMGERKQKQNLLLGQPQNPKGSIGTEFLAVASIQAEKA